MKAMVDVFDNLQEFYIWVFVYSMTVFESVVYAFF